MMRSQRRATPFFALLAFEILAIAGLRWLGSFDSMSIPSDQGFLDWVNTNQSIDALAMPLLRYAALGLAYWMLVSTVLFVAAQVTRVPIAIRLAGMFTLPSVRRAVDGAMAVSVATTSMVGFSSMAAFSAAEASTNQTDISSLVTSMPDLGLSGSDVTLGAGATVAPSSGGDSVVTPTFGAASTDESTTTSSSTTSSTEAPTTTSSTTSSTVDSTTSTLPTTTSSTVTTGGSDAGGATTLAPSAGKDYVPTPKPGAQITTTTVPQGPSTSATAPSTNGNGAEQTPVPSDNSASANVNEHRVVPGDNLWTIARDHIAQSTNRSSSQISEVEIRTYWLKVIDANRGQLRSNDPHWIFPGEMIKLPSLDGSVTGS